MPCRMTNGQKTAGASRYHGPIPTQSKSLFTHCTGRIRTYESLLSANLNRKQPMEKGPFGRATHRRSMSRTKTATPATKEDVARVENNKTVDDLFGKFKAGLEEKQVTREQKPATSATLYHFRSSMDIIAPSGIGPAGPQSQSFKEPTEVILYGYGSEYQYAAIEFYESASNGRIYEDYDRYPPHPRYTTSLSGQRSHIPHSLSQAAIRKINTYQGGNHWIKVTFDSPDAAGLACHYSPHVIHGYVVSAEPYRGEGPNADTAVTVTPANMHGANSLRQRRPTRQDSTSNWNSIPSHTQYAPVASQTLPGDYNSSTSSDTTMSSATAIGTGSGTDQTLQLSTSSLGSSQQTLKPLRIANATRAVLLPASSALLPVPPWTTRAFGHWPLIGAMFGGDGSNGDIIGGAVPRKEEGGFDWDKASFWWRACWKLDNWFGTDMCGMRGDD